MPEKIDPITLKSYEKECKEKIKYSGIYGLQNEFRDETGSRPDEGVTESFIALERCLTSNSVMRDKVKESFNGGVLNKRQTSFINLYSLFCGASEGLNYINKNFSNQVGTPSVNIDYTSEDLSSKILDLYMGVVKQGNVKDGKKLLVVTKSLFNGILSDAKAQKEKYNGMEKLVKTSQLQVYRDGVIFDGFSYGLDRENDAVFSTEFKDLVALEQEVDFLSEIGSHVCGYDPKEQKNIIKKVPWSILYYGEPGTGKTCLADALGNYLSTLTASLGLNFYSKSFSNSDKSKWHGESAQILKDRLSILRDPKAITYVYINDFDTIFQSRGDNDPSHVEIQLTGELMQQIDNTISAFKKKGCSGILVVNTNRPGKIDSAQKRRFSLTREIKRISKSDDYAKLIQIKTNDELKDGYVKLTDSDFKQIGDLCESYNLTGSDIDSIVTRSVRKASPGILSKEFLKELQKLPFEKRVQAVRQKSNTIGLPVFLEEIETQYATKK